jgi:hypothetical protein
MSWSAQPVTLTVVSSGPWQGHRIALPVGTHTIGRAPAGGIVIADETLSREHARLHHDGTRVTVVDLGSRNGTRVNDYRIVGAHELRDGDLVQLGAVDLRFEGPRRDEAARRGGAERRRRSPVAMMLVFGVVATFLGLAVDAAFDFLRKDWSNPFGIGMVATLTFASALIPVLQQAGSGGSGGRAAPATRPPHRARIAVAVLVVLAVCTGGAGGAAWVVQYAGGYITGHEVGPDLLVEETSASAGPLTLTVHAVLDTAHFTRVEITGANDGDDSMRLPVFENCFLTAGSGLTLTAGAFRSDWPEAIPPHGAVRGFLTFGRRLPPETSVVSLAFTTVFVQGFGGPDSITVPRIRLRWPADQRE